MYPWMLNLYIDNVVREVNSRTFGRGAQMVGENREK